ncbi:hypothetical protein [Sphingobacterium suaedae]|uniref:Lipoprotein n=1 Tax=Sphingobacterium suaedae TaxID=1686402 RepID=A0ABW5KC30_9SPHI
MKYIKTGRYLSLLALVSAVGCHTPTGESQQVTAPPDSLHVRNRPHETLVYANDTISIYQIDSLSFFAEQDRENSKRDTIPYLTDIAQVKDMLAGRVVFGGWNAGTDQVDSLLAGEMIASIQVPGEKLTKPVSPTALYDASFSKYFPDEDILLLEGGHTSDLAIDLKSGNTDVGQVGNPDYVVQKQGLPFRLTGWFPGQECSSYFLQRRVGDRFVYYTSLPIHVEDKPFTWCTLTAIFWKSEKELYFRNTYFGNTDDERLGFFKLIIK